MNNNVIEMRNINKQFDGIAVLKDINFTVHEGEVHVLFGENGSGKTVLMKILSGILKQDSGQIFFNGDIVEISSYRDAQLLGIKAVFQDELLFGELTVAENLFISKIPNKHKSFISLVNPSKTIVGCNKVFESMNIKIDPKRLVKDLQVWERKFVEIAKAIMMKPKVIIMDEPTNLFTNDKIENVYNIIQSLKEKGIAIIYISHHIEEVLKIADRITILNECNIVSTGLKEQFGKESLIKLSAGNDYVYGYPKLPIKKGREFFRVQNITVENVINNISFNLRKGEILGIAGLVGSGRTGIAKALFGVNKLSSGEIYLNGTKLNIKSPKDAIKAGIGFVSEDRLQEGLIEEFDIPSNITLPSLNSVKRGLFLKNEKEKEIARKFIKKLVIKTPFVEQEVKKLSGGNQQKIVLSKWMFSGSKLFIFDEPTTGLDTGSKVEVYNMMNEIVLNNSAIILISSNLSELLGMSDRIICLYDGCSVMEMSRENFRAEKVLEYITDVKNKKIN